MEMGWKRLGRFLGVPSLFMNFVGIFPCMESSFSPLCVYSRGVPSNFLLDCVVDTWASAGRVSLPALYCAPDFHCVVDCQLLLWVHVDRVHGHTGHLLPFL